MDTATSAMVSYGIVVEKRRFVNIFFKIYRRFSCQESYACKM